MSSPFKRELLTHTQRDTIHTYTRTLKEWLHGNANGTPGYTYVLCGNFKAIMLYRLFWRNGCRWLIVGKCTYYRHFQLVRRHCEKIEPSFGETLCAMLGLSTGNWFYTFSSIQRSLGSERTWSFPICTNSPTLERKQHASSPNMSYPEMQLLHNLFAIASWCVCSRFNLPRRGPKVSWQIELERAVGVGLVRVRLRSAQLPETHCVCLVLLYDSVDGF